MVQSLGHGGCERDAAKLAVSLDRDKFEPRIGVMRAGGFRLAEVQAAGIPTEHFPVSSFMKPSLFKAARQFGKYVSQNAIQIVHAFDVPSDIFAGIASRVYGVPRLITAQLSYRELVAPRERMLLRLADRLSDAVVVNSNAVGDSLNRDYRIPRDKIFLCYNGINSQDFYPAKVQRPGSLKDASIVIGSVCVMRPEKRMDWLVQSFADVHNKNPGARLLLVGSGPETTKLQALATELEITEKVIFVPGQAQIADWLRAIDIYVNASVSESFPNALLEAMACGCCVIGSAVGGIPELIDHGKTGLTFATESRDSLTEALSRVLRNAELRESMRQQGSVVAHERFSMSNTADRMQSLYARLSANEVIES